MNKNKGIVLYLHVHQPWRIREYSIFDVAWKHNYFSGGQNPDQDNQKIFQKVAEKSYLPMNALLEKLLRKYPDFKISLSFSGTFLEQAERFNPEVLESFKRLVKTGQVEILSSPYHHSLAFSIRARNSSVKLSFIAGRFVRFLVRKREFWQIQSWRIVITWQNGLSRMALRVC